MIKKIHELRQKSHAEKEKIALLGATVVTLLIVLFWIAGVTAFPTTNESQKADTTGPIKEITNSFSNTFKN